MHFAAGVNLLRDPGRPRYDEALAEFKRAYAIKPAPSILGNMALCAMKLERDAEAIELYTRYLKEASALDGEERAQVERDLETLKAGLAQVTLSSKPDGAIVHDVRVPARGEPVTNIYGPLVGPSELGIRRGHHVMTARYPDGAEARWEIDVNGGEAHVFEKPSEAVVAPASPTPLDGGRERGPEPSRRPIPKSVYISGLATAAVGAGALVTGILALDARARFDTANDGSDPARADDLRASGQTLNVVSDVCLVGTIIGAAVTAYLYVTRPALPPSKASAAAFSAFAGGVSGHFW